MFLELLSESEALKMVLAMIKNIAETSQFFSLAPWIVFLPIIGLLFNIAFGGMILERSKRAQNARRR